MNTRLIGCTGIRVSEIGLGAWQLANPAWGLHDESEGLGIVAAALDSGCTFFDTAPNYGSGRSEEILGRALKSIRGDIILCTKFGHTPDGDSDFAATAVRPGLEQSLRRLQTDYVDILLLHNPPPEFLDSTRTDIYAELDRLRAQGLIRAYGVSLDTAEDLESVANRTPCQVAEVLFNAFHQQPTAAFPAARAAGLGLIAKVPLDSGWLSSKYNAAATFDGVRDRWSPDVIARRAGLAAQFAGLLPANLPIPAAALQFILAHPEISTVIPGAKSPEQARSNFAAAATPLAPDLFNAIRAFWKRELSNNPLPW